CRRSRRPRPSPSRRRRPSSVAGPDALVADVLDPFAAVPGAPVAEPDGGVDEQVVGEAAFGVGTFGPRAVAERPAVERRVRGEEPAVLEPDVPGAVGDLHEVVGVLLDDPAGGGFL